MNRPRYFWISGNVNQRIPQKFTKRGKILLSYCVLAHVSSKLVGLWIFDSTFSMGSGITKKDDRLTGEEIARRTTALERSGKIVSFSSPSISLKVESSAF